MTWAFGEGLDEAVTALEGKGVASGTYNMPGVVMDGPVHVMGDMKVVGFKDPDVAILSPGND